MLDCLQSSFLLPITRQGHITQVQLLLEYLPPHYHYPHNSITMAPRVLISAFRPIASSCTPITCRALSTTPRMALKEDGNRTPEELEQKKQEQLKEQKEGKGRWREDLASAGESNIAADKQHVNDHDSHIKELQQEGKNKSEKGDL